MSYLLMLAAAAAVKKERDRQRAAARRRAKAKGKKYESDAMDYGEDYYDRGLKSYYECLKIELRSDKELEEFFKEFCNIVQVVRREKGQVHEENVKKTLELMDKYKEGRKGLVTKMEGLGIKLSNELMNWYDDLESFDLTVDRYKGQYYREYTEFNGVPLTLEILENPDDTTFEDRYNQQKERADELRKLQEQKEEEIKRLQLLLKISPFKRYERRQQIENLQSEIRGYQSDYDREITYKDQLEAYKALTPEQREVILDYLKAGKCMHEASRLIEREVRAYKAEIPKVDDKELIQEAFDRLATQRGMGEKELMHLYELLDKVAVKRFRGAYDSTSIYESSYGKEYERGKMIRTFLEEIYMDSPDAMERNLGDDQEEIGD